MDIHGYSLSKYAKFIENRSICVVLVTKKKTLLKQRLTKALIKLHFIHGTLSHPPLMMLPASQTQLALHGPHPLHMDAHPADKAQGEPRSPANKSFRANTACLN